MAMLTDLLTCAELLARDNAEDEPNIREILLFPDEEGEEIRLVEIDPTAMPSQDCVVPFYFEPDSQSEIPFRLAIALILPEEKYRLKLPEGWGTWEQGKTMWPRGKE
jgi:hypothetical protein